MGSKGGPAEWADPDMLARIGKDAIGDEQFVSDIVVGVACSCTTQFAAGCVARLTAAFADLAGGLEPGPGAPGTQFSSCRNLFFSD